MAGKYQGPDDIEDLTKIYYEGDPKNEKQKYESYLQSALSPYCEKDIKNVFACIGEITKIPRDTTKTFDFEIKSKNIMIEVTQIFHPVTFNPVVDPNNKIRKTIAHIGEKESNESAIRGGAVYYSTITSFLANLPVKLEDEEFITCEMAKYNLSFILFLPEPANNANPFEEIQNPKLLYVVKVHSAVFDCLDSSIKIQKF